MSSPAFTLYAYWRSSCSWRVRIGLQLKAIDAEIVPVHLVRDGGEHRKTDFVRKSPLAQVPVLEWEENGEVHRLTQSMAILDFLDTFEGTPLIPSERNPRAKSLELAEIVNAGIQPLQNLSTMLAFEAAGADKKAFAKAAIEKGLHALESRATSAGNFLVGNSPTIADICLIPQLYNARRFGIDLTPFPTLLRAEESAMKLEAFQRAHPDQQPDAQPA